MPGPCITCHGGRGDALVPDATESSRSPSCRTPRRMQRPARRDVQAHLAPLEVDTLRILSVPGFTRAEQEDGLKTMNMFVLCTYPRRIRARRRSRRTSGPRPSPHGPGRMAGNRRRLDDPSLRRRRLASRMYANTSFHRAGGASRRVPNVVAPSCRACHILRGTAGPTDPQSDIDFTTLAKFESFAKTVATQEPNDRLRRSDQDARLRSRRTCHSQSSSATRSGVRAILRYWPRSSSGRGFTVHDAEAQYCGPAVRSPIPGPTASLRRRRPSCRPRAAVRDDFRVDDPAERRDTPSDFGQSRFRASDIQSNAPGTYVLRSRGQQ